MGMRFCTEKRTLKSFCRAMGDIAIAEVEADRVLAYIAGTGPVTWFWHRKHTVLIGFYRFAIARRYVPTSPLPKVLPKPPQTFVPYIYSHEELRRLLEATALCSHPRGKIQAHTFRALILLLYGAGLRISEALALTLGDVNLLAGVIQICESKFYKTRLVPLGPDLINVLTRYVTERKKEYSTRPGAPFFISRTGSPIKRGTAEGTFNRLRLRTGVQRHDGGRFQPRLHDLRHSFATHRLVSGTAKELTCSASASAGYPSSDVHIAATQRYLTATPNCAKPASA
jgi:site-specific recombinase XerD